MALRWEKQKSGGSEWAYSGKTIVGMIGKLDVEPFDYFYLATNAVSMRWIAKGAGNTKSLRAARRAVERAWSAWLHRADLITLPEWYDYAVRLAQSGRTFPHVDICARRLGASFACNCGADSANATLATMRGKMS